MVEYCAGVFLLRFKEGELKENQIVVEVRSWLQSRANVFLYYTAGKTAKTLTVPWNEVLEQVLRGFLGYVTKQKDGTYVAVKFMSVGRLHAWMMTVVRCLVDDEKCRGHHQKLYVDSYGRIVEIELKQSI